MFQNEVKPNISFYNFINNFIGIITSKIIHYNLRTAMMIIDTIVVLRINYTGPPRICVINSYNLFQWNC
jgi:hypothetical protein